MENGNKNIVTIGGGTGSYTILMGIKNILDINISAIVAMTDDGGSTGVLRDELGVLPAGDVRQCLIALSEESDVVRKLMSYRFEDGALAGHNFGNIFLAGLEKVSGSFSSGVEEASKVLKIKGKVLPVINQKATLCAELKNGILLKGENDINHYDLGNVGIHKLYIEAKEESENKSKNNLTRKDGLDNNFINSIEINPHAQKAILEADYILVGPGNHYCSVLPALAVHGVSDAIQNTKAKIIYISNLTNKKGHTLHFKVSKYVTEIESYINKKLDYIIINSESPTDEQVKHYELVEGDGVLVLDDMHDDCRVIRSSLLSHKINIQNKTDKISDMRSFIRHDSDKIKIVLENIIQS